MEFESLKSLCMIIHIRRSVGTEKRNRSDSFPPVTASALNGWLWVTGIAVLFMVCIYAMAARADTKPTFQEVICSSDEGHKELLPRSTESSVSSAKSIRMTGRVPT